MIPARPLLRVLALLAAAVAPLALPSEAWAQTISTGSSSLGVYGKPAPGSPTFQSFSNQFDPSLSTTVFTIQATSSDGSQLSYAWRLNATCGNLTAPGADQPRNGYYHGPTAANPNGCPPPPGGEINTTVTVTVFRSQDKDPTDPNGGPIKGSPYFEYFMVARAGDEDATASYPAMAQLDYFGNAAATTPSPRLSPATATAPAASPAANKGAGGAIWALLVLVVLAVTAVTVWLYWNRARTVERPPVDPCANEKAELAAAEAALAAAQAKFAPLDAAQKKLSAAQSRQLKAQEAWSAAEKASGAVEHTDTLSSGEKTIVRKHWSYKYPTHKAEAEKAHAELEAANAAVAEAQTAFDAVGGMTAWNQAHNALTDAENRVKAARAALEKCLGANLPAPPPTSSAGPGTTSAPGGVTAAGGDVPKTVEKPKDPCEGKPVKTTEICRGTVTENRIGQMKLLKSGWFESGDNAREIFRKFRMADDALSMASSVKDAFTNPIGSILDSVQRAGEMFHKLPPKPPGSYQDAMKDALVKGLEDLTFKLDNFHETILEMQGCWPVLTYEYVGTVTCTCKNGVYEVSDRSFTVTYKPPETIATRELSSGGSSGMITKDDVDRMVGVLLRQLVTQNDAAEKTLYDMQAKVDAAGCG